MQTNMEGQFINPVQMQSINQVQLQPILVPLRNEPKNVSAYRGLAITQLVIGVLNLIFGVVIILSLEHVVYARTGTGLWNGIFILIAGILGVVAVKDLRNRTAVNVAYMVFSIIATHFALAGAIMSIIGALLWCWMDYRSCPNEEAARALFGVLFFLNLIEFVISIVAAVFCCRNSVCCMCCDQSTQGVIINQPAQYQTVAYTAGNTITTIPQSQDADIPMKGDMIQGQLPAYTQQAYPGQMISQAPITSYPGQINSQAPNHMIISAQPQLTPGEVNVSYSAEAPPMYSSK